MKPINILFGIAVLMGNNNAIQASQTYQNPYVQYSTEPTENCPNKINILAFNVFMLKIEVLGITIKAETEPFIKTRARLLEPHLEGYDVIVFSELFQKEARQIILEAAKRQGYKYASCILGEGKQVAEKFGLFKHAYHEILEIPTIDFNNPKFGVDPSYTQGGNPTNLWGMRETKPIMMNGGVIIVSKYPIVQARCMFYKDCTSWDCSAKKGVVYTQINKEGKKYHIFGTHPQAGNDDSAISARTSQFKALAAMIEKLNIAPCEPVIIAGDLNLGRPEDTQNCFQIVGANAPALRGDELYSSNSPKLGLRRWSGPRTPRRLDYVAHTPAYEQPIKCFNEIRPFYSITPWGIRIDPKKEGDEPEYKEYNEKNKKFGVPVSDLSDHFAVYGYFEF